MRTIRGTEVDIIGDVSNAAVIRLPERRFLGLVVQCELLRGYERAYDHAVGETRLPGLFS